jgi:tRNA dimethylallyltransferase
MINDGLLAEAKLFPNKELNALQTVGYRELFSYFDREISLEFAIEEMKNTRRFSKRQLTLV